jgi:ribosomal protein S18 acetylase RimI-like enzyme
MKERATVKTYYTILLSKVEIAIADLVKPGELTSNWTITRINVPYKYRGLGHGRELLRRITADADAEGATLELDVFPSGELGYEELEAWYRRNGFRYTDYGHMRRRPNENPGQCSK